MIFRMSRDGKITLQNGDTTVRCTVAEFQTLEPGFEYTAGDELWSPERAYLTVANNQGANPHDRAPYLTPEKLATYAAALEPEPEPEPEAEPDPKDWEGFRVALYSNPDFLAFLESSPLAAKLDDLIWRRQFSPLATTLWQRLKSQGHISEGLEGAIVAAATEANLLDELAIVTGQA